MSRPSTFDFSPARPLIVAAISTHANLAIALKRPSRAVDLFEIRADCWAADPSLVLKAIPKFKRPLLLTVRHPKEGGQNELSRADRGRLFELFLPAAHAVDVEARSLRELASIVETALQNELPLVVSFHDFKGMPALEKLRELADRAADSGASAFKIAVTPRKPDDIARLVEFLTGKSRLPLAVMGMGKWGKLSRLACASLGSVLNYGYMDQAQVPGQWQADRFRERLNELNESPDPES